jgi:hypothetical protein
MNVSSSTTRSTTPRSSEPKTESESNSGRQRSESGLDVTDVPDKVLEALNVVRMLKQAAYDDELPPGRAVELGDEIELLLRQVLETMARAAAEQLAKVAANGAASSSRACQCRAWYYLARRGLSSSC